MQQERGRDRLGAPEDVELSEARAAAGDGENVCNGTVSAKDFLGDYLDFQVKVGDVVLLAKAHPSLRTPTGDPIYLRMKAREMRRHRRASQDGS